MTAHRFGVGSETTSVTKTSFHILMLFTGAWLMSACEPIPAQEISVFEDLGAPRIDQGVALGVDSALEGPINGGSNGQPMADLDCERDGDCENTMWCSNAGRCVEATASSVVPTVMDGVTRAGVAVFELVPEHFDSWHDRASADCPENRPGYFDGRLDVAKPDDPCSDAFDDLDGDGRFDAVWLGGPDLDRPAMGVDDENPPQGRVVVLTKDDLVIILLSLDLYALERGRIDSLTRQLSNRLGLPSRAFVVHTTGNRSGPDTVGLSGPSWRTVAPGLSDVQAPHLLEELNGLMELPVRSGVHPAWWDEFVRRTDAAIRRATQMRKMVSVRNASARLPIRRSKFGASAGDHERVDEDELDRDESRLERWRSRRWPLVRDEHIPSKLDDVVRVVTLDSVQSQTPHIVLTGWGAAPSMSTKTNKLSADYPGRIRQSLEDAYPGSTAVWLTSAAADTHVADSQVFIPDVDDDGHLIGDDGELTEDPLLARRSDEPLEDLTRLLVTRITDSLSTSEPELAELSYQAHSVWVPVGNPRLALAASLGLLPRQRDWLSGQTTTNAWVSRDAVPDCGGLGCLRFRLDRIQFSAGHALITAPGALDQAYVLGRRGLTVHYEDARNYQDLDGDGLDDVHDDDGIVVSARVGPDARSFEIHQAANPQTFDPVIGLGDESTWIVGRTNGGWGSLRSAGERINVFEGQIDALVQRASSPDVADLKIADLGYTVPGDLTVAAVANRLMAVAPQLLANLTSSHELNCRAEMPVADGPERWSLSAPDGALLAEGDDLLLGPGTRVYSPSVNFALLEVPDGSMLHLPDLRDTGWPVTGVVPLVMREHPNAGDAWASTASAGGDYVYNGLCELMSADGVCQTARAIRRDPNPQLPRMRHSHP